jgi:hypothetical protein
MLRRALRSTSNHTCLMPSGGGHDGSTPTLTLIEVQLIHIAIFPTQIVNQFIGVHVHTTHFHSFPRCDIDLCNCTGHVKDILDISRSMQIVYSASRSHDVIFSLSKKKKAMGRYSPT